MNKQVRRLSFLVISVYCLLRQIHATQINMPDIEAISLTGKTYSRWMITGAAPGYAPFHSAFIADIMPTVTVNPFLTIKYLLRFENPSVSDGYDAMQKVIGRYSVDLHKKVDYANVENVSFLFGDLGKTTLGKGLLLKDLESQGFDLNLKMNSGWITGLRYVGHGYSLPGDYAVFYAQNDSRSLGGYLFSSIDDSQYFSTYTNIIGLYTSIDLCPIMIDFEAAYGLDGQFHSQAPRSLLISPNPSLSKRSKSEVKHKVMHHYILKAAALKEKGRPSRLKTE